MDPPPPGTTRSAPAGAVAYVVVAGVFIAAAAFIINLVIWVAMQLALAADTGFPPVRWPIYTAITAACVIAVTLPIMFMRSLVRLYRIGVSWLAAAVIMALLGLVRLVPLTNGTLTLAIQAGALIVTAAVLWLATWRAVKVARDIDSAASDTIYRDRPTAPGAFWWALCAGALTLVPWAGFGALGEFWETVAAAVAALGFAAVAAFLLGDRFWVRFAHVTAAKRIFGGGAAAGITLLILAVGIGGAGIQLLAMVTVPALGFVIAALQTRAYHTGRIVAAAVAPAVFGPLAFFDADEFLPATFGPEFGYWAGIAVLLAIVVAWIAAVIAGFSHRTLVRYPAVGAALAVVVAAVIATVHPFHQTGFHGEKLLVIMVEQSDLSEITGDQTQRGAEVHSRLIDTAERTQRDLRADLTADGIAYRPFYLVNAVEVPDAPFRRQQLEARDDVAEVLLAPQSRPVPEPEAPLEGGPLGDTAPQPNIDQVNAPKAWADGADGSGITIGISDSGVDGAHPALADRFRGGDDSWIDPINGSTTPVDPNGHGTHALGLALGGNGIGVAPGADWIGCANLPRNAGNPADYLACLQFMLAPYPSGGDPFSDGDPGRAPDIATNSWSCPQIEGCDSTVFGGAIKAFETAGIFFVAAAGNAGPACGSAGTPPANDPTTFTVGAVNSHDTVVDFSGRGPVDWHGESFLAPAVVAPGFQVVSAVPGGGYDRLSGTSMATPHVAGAVAVLWSAQPSLVGDISATQKLLAQTARPVITANGAPLDACGVPANTAGAGIIDVAAAVKAAKS